MRKFLQLIGVCLVGFIVLIVAHWPEDVDLEAIRKLESKHANSPVFVQLNKDPHGYLINHLPKLDKEQENLALSWLLNHEKENGSINYYYAALILGKQKQKLETLQFIALAQLTSQIDRAKCKSSNRPNPIRILESSLASPLVKSFESHDFAIKLQARQWALKYEETIQDRASYCTDEIPHEEWQQKRKNIRKAFFSGTKVEREPVAEKVRSPYPIINSNIQTSLSSANARWIDNDRVIFGGMGKPIPRGETDKKLDFGVYIWDTTNNSVSKYDDIQSSGLFVCYANGNAIYYKKRGKSEAKGVLGPLGQGKEITLPGGTFIRAGFDLDPVNCQLQKRAAQYEPEAPRTSQLLPGHGHIDLGTNELVRSTEVRPVFHVRSTDQKKTVLPWQGGQVPSTYGFHYYPHRGAYMIGLKSWDEAKQWSIDPNKIGEPKFIGWLYPDGRTESSLLPWAEWLKSGGVSYFSTTKGYFITSHNSAAGLGGYLYANGRYQKIITGYLNSVAVSPDGCKVVYTNTTSGLWASAKGRKDPFTLRMINLCKERGDDGN